MTDMVTPQNVKTEIRDEIDENNFDMDVKPSTTRSLDYELDNDFPVCEPSDVKRQLLLSINLRRPFIAPARDAKNVVEIKKDASGHLPMLLRKNWKKANVSHFLKHLKLIVFSRFILDQEDNNPKKCPNQ